MVRYTAAVVPLQCSSTSTAQWAAADSILTSPKVTDCAVLPAAAHTWPAPHCCSLHHDNQVLSCCSLLTRLSTHQEAGAAPERDHLLCWLDSAETEEPLLAWYGAPAAGGGDVLHTMCSLLGDLNAAWRGGAGYLGWDRRLHWSLGHVTAAAALAGARSAVCSAPHPPHDCCCCCPATTSAGLVRAYTQHSTAQRCCLPSAHCDQQLL